MHAQTPGSGPLGERRDLVVYHEGLVGAAGGPGIEGHALRAVLLEQYVPSNGGETITVPRYDGVDIRFDGRLDEAVWSEVGGYDNMVLVEPGTLAKPRHRTVARYLHTVRGVYIGVWNEQPRRTLAGRGATDHDAWGITLDTSGDGRHGHWFNIALSTAVDGTSGPRSANGPREPTWQYATAVLRNGWSLEAFLPWSALSLPSLEEDRVMGMYVNRRVAYMNERWGWPASFTPTRDTTER